MGPSLYERGFPFPLCRPQSAFLQCKEENKKANVKKKAHFTTSGIQIETLENVHLKGEKELRANCGLKLYQMTLVPISMNNQKLSDLDRTVATNWQDRRLPPLSLS